MNHGVSAEHPEDNPRITLLGCALIVAIVNTNVIYKPQLEIYI